MPPFRLVAEGTAMADQSDCDCGRWAGTKLHRPLQKQTHRSTLLILYGSFFVHLAVVWSTELRRLSA